MEASTGAFQGFGDFGGRVWLNTAHQGPLPLAAAVEAREAVEWKTSPRELTGARFDAVPRRLRAALGRLINAPDDEIILANSASYGLNVIANGFPWRPGDEILAMTGDFPSDLLPWQMVEARGEARLIRLQPRERVISPEELEAAITPRTRLFCTTWVHSFSGYATDPAALGEICRRRGVRFVLNVSQGLGARPLDVGREPVDAVVGAGWKWLCGPYGCGFCWMSPELRELLRRVKAYWLSMLTAEDLSGELRDPVLPDRPDAHSFDVFAPANFFNFKPWAASIEFLLAHGIERIRDHDDGLVDQFVDGLDPRRFEVLSPRERSPRRSTLVFLSHRDRALNPAVQAALAEAGVDVALRGGALRVAPHLHTSGRDIARALDVLNRFRSPAAAG